MTLSAAPFAMAAKAELDQDGSFDLAHLSAIKRRDSMAKSLLGRGHDLIGHGLARFIAQLD